ncbi:MAG TPA: YDG domain-containing protein, partial [Bryobacteraceae bacterium]|nr:YDG domain-containing protein [Bryobacteraceae bacterium]
ETAGTYDAADAGARTVTAALGTGDFTQNGGTNLSNYILPISATGAGLINPKVLTAAISGMPSKSYDGTTAASLVPGDYTLSGFAAGEGASVAQTAGTYDAADAGSRTLTAALSSGDFTQDSGTNLSNYILPTSASGAGMINAKALTASILGTTTKTYDGGTAAVLLPSDYALSGFVTGQGATVTQTAGTYDSADAGSRTVTATLGAGNFTQNSGTNLSNYILPTSASGAGMINQKTLTAAVTGTPEKAYDGTTGANLAADDYTLSGFVAGQGAAVTQTSGTYDAADAGARTVTASLGSGDFSANSGTNLVNYLLPTTASGAGLIDPKALTATIVNASKTYDGSTGAVLGAGNFLVTGFAAGQGATITQTAGVYAAADAGSHTVTAILPAADVILTGGANVSNYILPSSASGMGLINPKLLTVAISGTPTKAYDATTLAALGSGDYTLTGFVAGQGANVTQTQGVYDSADAGSRGVSASLSGADFAAAAGTNLANYLLPTSAVGRGYIDRRLLTASIVGTPTKMKDGTLVATLSPGNFALNGFTAGQGAGVTQTLGSYDLADTGSRIVSANLGAQYFVPHAGTLLSNYLLPVSAMGAGAITPAILMNAPTLSDAVVSNLIVRNLASATNSANAALQAVFAAAVPRTYIPYPAPSALSTWQNNGFGSLPAIVNANPTTSGAPVINTTEQILLQGGKDKSWHIELPPVGVTAGATPVSAGSGH